MPPTALALVGPTAAGKTGLALRVAERLDGEIIAMDSRTVYRGMDIGTAKPTAAERARIPHHGLDLVRPGERYSAGRFARQARRWIAEVRRRGRVPVLVGGTGFFLRALTRPLFREPPMDRELRDRLKDVLEALDAGELRRWLGVLDPVTAARLEGRGGGGGRQRLLRALELPLLTGRPLSWWHEHGPPGPAPVEALTCVLSLPRDLLYERINRRVERMVEAGFVDEVRRLLEEGHDAGTPGMTATGYPQMAAHLAGEATLDEAIVAIQRATRRFARRQLTWFRNQLPEDAVWLDGTLPVDALVDEVAETWRTRAS